jgi:hypothetical protein
MADAPAVPTSTQAQIQARAEATSADVKPAPVKPSVKVISAKNRPSGHNGVPPGRRDAAVKAMGKLQAQVAKETPGVAAPAGEDAQEAADSQGIESPLAADVLEGETEAPAIAPERQSVLDSRAESKKRIADFEAKKAERRAGFERAEAEKRAKADFDRREAELRARSELVDLADKDPYELLKKKGIAPSDLVKRAIDEGDPNAALLKRVEAAEAKLAEEARARETWSEQEKQRQFIAQVQAYEEKFFEPMKAAPAKFATVRRYAHDYVQQRCRKVAQDYYAEAGVYPGTPGAGHSHEDILTHVQDLISQEEAAIEAAQAAPQAPGANRAGPKSPAATITGSLSARGSAPDRKLTREERTERAKGMMRAGTRH